MTETQQTKPINKADRLISWLKLYGIRGMIRSISYKRSGMSHLVGSSYHLLSVCQLRLYKMVLS